MGSRLRAGDDGAGPRLRDFRRRLRSPAGAVPRSRRRFPQAALQNRHHGFSNIRETLQELHHGHAKAYPVRRRHRLDGRFDRRQVALCHRFAGSEDHNLGNVRDGVSFEKQQEFLQSHHIANKTDCQTCWARPICAGGCYHEAHTRYGSTNRPNLHYCEWIRGWTHTCLEIYGEIAERNPDFLRQFDDEEVPEKVS